MTFEELLQASASGLPKVMYNGVDGRVTVIKDNGSFKGCACRFKENYDHWFYAADGDDKRSKYMKDLTLIKEL